MVKVRFRYLTEDRDRHGNIRIYVRLPGRRKVRIHAPFGTDEFITAYNAAVSDHVSAPRQVRETKAGSFRHICVLYFDSKEFRRLDLATQTWRKRHLDKISEQHGHRMIAHMQAQDVAKLRDELDDHPPYANQRLKALKALFAWVCDKQPRLAPNNPTLGVKMIKYVTDGHHTWTREEILKFRARHPIGTRARLACDLLLYTSGRREDVIRLGPRNIQDGWVRFVQAKNEHRNPVEINIPLHPDLVASIAAIPVVGAKTFLLSRYGRPFSHSGFGDWFANCCKVAGLPHCSAHGLRKAIASHLAEQGASPHDIAAITGHRSLAEVERYTREADRKRGARRAIEKIKL